MSIKKKNWKYAKNPNEARLMATDSIPDQSLKVKGKALQEYFMDGYLTKPSRFPVLLLSGNHKRPNNTCSKGTTTPTDNKFKLPSLSFSFDLLTKKIKRSPRVIGNTICVKYHYCKSKGKIYCAEMMQNSNAKSDLDLWPLDPKSIGVFLGSQSTLTSSIIVVRQNILELLCEKGAKLKLSKFVLDLWPLDQKLNWGPRSFMNNSCEVLSMNAKRKWNYCAETVQSFKSEFDLDLWIQKSTEVLLWSWSKHVLSIITLWQKGDGVIVRKRCKYQSTNLTLIFWLQNQ